ncbi:tectonin beta-propeller repeat-containing protein 1-like isoform X1 [Amphibalanus amphitrite]|uniref:tectonin beta-propeller repeat-containing protein 1-like isoform X1 n=1 Tax=Amphibalanus amphitrite TaxID=1232801 RepID=UPI001C922885|nr:tectonin beta-propeller repeat-containing protein 1-like isoform X1 [Amphibalanus amphitrite]XP_043220429.1 tectonin beta-propeller repeat-containing protein 1-like isoform X1 [Amphibalanus amphitrite]
MPASLFCVDILGRIYELSTSSSKWEPLSYLGVEFKRLSASEHSLWAIGGDQQVYVLIYGTDNPIRVMEETYENQRWNPIDGFCDKLLGTDRYHFSSMDGKTERRFTDVDLPSLGWQWEGDWQLDSTLNGTQLETEGWTYAVDFPAAYSPCKRFTSCVRRRRWVRYRRYVAVNTWSSVPPLHRDSVEEPFVDVAVGGSELAGWEPDNLMVWAVTIRGRVIFRSGVGRLSPEGVSWLPVATPRGSEASQISCGPSGLTWALTWDGCALVRTGMTRETPHGTDWCQVPPPDGVRLEQVSVGDNSVWAVSSDKRVFFRQGVKGHEMSSNPTLARGTNWLEMVGSMSAVSVGPNNQVVALGTDGVQLYVRGRVSHAELTGHTWRPLTVPHPGAAGSSRSGSVASLPVPASVPADWPDGPPAASGDGQGAPEPAGCPYDSDTSSMSGQSAGDTASLRLLRLDDDEPSAVPLGRAGPECRGWTSVAAGGCFLDPLHVPPWFSGPVVADRPEELWRQKVLELLKERDSRVRPFNGLYDEAIERSSWTRTTKCRWWTDAPPHNWAQAVLELEQRGTGAAQVEFGQISVYVGGEKMASVCLSEVSAVLNSSESRRQSVLAVLTAERMRRRLPLKLWFAEEAEMEDWLDMIQTACVRLRRIEGAPSENCLWAVTDRGDIMVSDQRLTTAEQELAAETHSSLSQCQLVSDPAGCPTPLCRRLERGFTEGCSLVISYKLPTHPSWFSINLMTGVTGSQETENVFHFNPRINRDVIVRNSRTKDGWGREERDGPQPFKGGDTGEIHIICLKDQFKVLAPGLCTLFTHRMDFRRITHVTIQGDILVTQVSYDAGPAEAAPEELFWRQLGGHLRRVEAGPHGVVWGLGHDQTPWVYTGATGGGQLTEHGGSGQLHTMTDTRYFYIYENQRWNPLSGFSYRGLATDRPTWSDRTGRVQLTKDTVLPPSRHWNWVSSWSVDFHVSGGVDEEGWQYAMDFPASYHGYRGMQDFVRRRRWYRKCHLKTTGPWECVNNVKLRDLSMHELGGEIHLWAVTSAGDVLHRLESRPDGSGGGGGWSSVTTDQPFAAISCGGHGCVWAVARDGTARLRCGVTAQRPLGTGWAQVEHPEGRKLKHVSAGQSAVWAVDDSHRLYWRQEINPVTFPMGMAWRHVSDHVSHVSCGAGNQTWAVSSRHSGVLQRRQAVCEEDSAGAEWQHGLPGGWSHVTCRGLRGPC